MNKKINLLRKIATERILKSIFYTLIITFLISGNILAQTETCIPIGSGISENNDYPFSGALTHSYLQQIYTAEELNAEYIINGEKITGISFNYFGDTPTKRPIKIFMGNTPLANLSSGWIPMTELSEVYSSDCQEFSKESDNWTKINLKDPFGYEGKNIVIAILMNIEDTSNQATCFTETNGTNRFYTHNVNMGISRYLKVAGNTPITFDTNGGLPKTVNNPISGNTTEKRSNIKFCKDGGNCPKVSVVTASNIGESSITLDWSNGSYEQSWAIEYGRTGFTLGEGNMHKVESHPYEINNLSGITSYDFYIRSNCSDNDKSDWLGPKTFSTLCGTVNSFDYTENFSNNSLSLECWTIIDANKDGKSNNLGKWSFTNNEAKYSASFDNKANDWIVSPKFHLQEDLTLTFEYKTKVYKNSTEEKFSVYIIPENIDNYKNVTTPILSKTVNNTSYIKIDPISLADYKNQDFYIGIKCESEADMMVLYIDNLRVFKQSSEKKITSFSLSSQIGNEEIIDNDFKVIVTVPHSSTLQDLIPTITVSEHASISPESGIAQNFNEDFTYTVTAEDGSYQDWTITVKKEDLASSEKEILNFTFPDIVGVADINQNTHTVTAVAKWNANLSEIKPTIEISPLASIDPPSNTSQDFSSEHKKYTVTAEDESYEDWKITITNETNPCLTSFQAPFHESFTSTSSSIDCWTIIDANKDAYNENNGKWAILDNEGYAQYKFSSSEAADDWLISPRISLPKDATLKFDYKGSSPFHEEKFSVWVITGDSPDDYNSAENIIFTQIAKNTSFITIPEKSLKQYEMQDVYFAIKCESEQNKNNLFITNFIISSEANQHIITSSSGENGKISPNGISYVVHGSSQTYNIIPDDKYTIDELLVDGKKIEEGLSGNKFEFTNVQDTHTIKVTFKAKTYTVSTKSMDEFGEITPETITVMQDDNYEFTITAQEGYELDKLMDNKTDKTSDVHDNKYILTKINEDHNITVQFKEIEIPITFTINANVFGGNGSITPTSKVVKQFEKIIFKITPDDGYTIYKLLDDGILKTNKIIDNEYILSNIRKNHNIIVEFISATNIKRLEDISVNIYPNPTNDVLNIEASDEISHIEIMSIDGKLLDKQKVNSKNFLYNTNSLAKGNYFVRIYTENNLIIKQLSVKR